MTARFYIVLLSILSFWGIFSGIAQSQEVFLELKGIVEAEDGPIRLYIEVGEKGQPRQLVKLKKDGSFFIELDLNMDYEFFVRADGYQPQLVKLNTRTSDETIEAGLKPLDFNIFMAKIPEKLMKEKEEEDKENPNPEEIQPVVSNVAFNKETGQFSFKEEYMKSVEGQKKAAEERKTQQIAQYENRLAEKEAQKESAEKNKEAAAERQRAQEEARLKEKQIQDSLLAVRRAEQAKRDAELAEVTRQREQEAKKEKQRLDSIQAANLRAIEEKRLRQKDSLSAVAAAQADKLERARLEAQRIKDSVDNARIQEQARINALIAAKAEEKRIRENMERARQDSLAKVKAAENGSKEKRGAIKN
jgi:hypothetical protein